ncbi:MAG TPA: YibE/F [Acidimicrobiaceae bacterium]|nr:YibE/F [Acidimicrobiaceae bacterium]
MARPSCTKMGAMGNRSASARRDAHGHHSHSPSHSHSHAPWATGPGMERSLWIAVGAWAVIAVVGLVLLWPGDRAASPFRDEPRADGQVESVTIQPCTGTSVEDLVECRALTVLITSGDTAGDRTVLEQAVTATEGRLPQAGDEIVLLVTTTPDGAVFYQFADYQRSGSMWVLVLLFAVCVVALGRWRGAGALAGLAVSVAVLVGFVLPALLDGSNPVIVAIVGSSVIAFASLYLAHGATSSTNVALLSTLVSLALTGALAWVFIELTTLTGLSDENALFLEAFGVQLDPRGLLLAGVVIGSLGVLDDVTVTQVSAVGELYRAQPGASARELYGQALTIGRDHISSTVNTLFLAYAGAALPLLLLFTETGAGVADVFTREVVAIEVVRTLVGSIGLIASVPISTWLAATVLTRDR